jgi:signal transduction histidine kinase
MIPASPSRRDPAGPDPAAPPGASRPRALGTALRYRLLVGAAVLFAAVDLLLGLGGPPTTGVAGPHAGLALQLVVDASLLLLIRAPRLVAALVIAASLLMAGSAAWAPGLFVPLVELSPVTVPRATPVIIIWLVLTEPAKVSYPVTAVLSVLAARVWAPSWSETPFGLLNTLLPAIGALYLDARRKLIRSLRDRAERAEREKYLLAEQARAEERRRLAMEMHDVVTHRLSGIVLHASALGVSSTEPAVRKAAEDIRASGAEALEELRDLVGVLRGGTGEGRPTTRDVAVPVGRVADLAAASTAVGLTDVELDVDGSPDDVTPTVARTAYRIVQEALTNVHKHAPGAAVTVHVRYRPERVRVRVANSVARRPVDPVLAGSGSGSGLAGLAQRVELIGGSFDCGPTEDGGYVVDAILPGYVPTSGSSVAR